MELTTHRKARARWPAIASLGLFAYAGLCLTQSGTVKKQAESLPRMTSDELVRNGPGKNYFITLTDVHLCSRGHAFYRDMDAAMQMYVPIYSRNDQEPAPPELKLLLEVLDDRDLEKLLAQPDVGELNCQVDRSVRDVDEGFITYLQTRYPGMPANLRLVSVGLHEPTVEKSERMWRDGAVSLLLGVALITWWALRRAMDQHAPIASRVAAD
jgi:hypothetical protein